MSDFLGSLLALMSQTQQELDGAQNSWITNVMATDKDWNFYEGNVKRRSSTDKLFN